MKTKLNPIHSTGSFGVTPSGALNCIRLRPEPRTNRQAALGTLTVTTGAAPLKVHRGQTAAAPARIGMDLAERDRTGMWEQLAFIVVWLCGVLSVWYCLKTVLSLPWPQ